MIQKLTIKIGETNAIQMSYFTSLVEVVSAAFGGKESSGKKGKPLDLPTPDLVNALNAIGRG